MVARVDPRKEDDLRTSSTSTTTFGTC